jgi:hypothetical protein
MIEDKFFGTHGFGVSKGIGSGYGSLNGEHFCAGYAYGSIGGVLGVGDGDGYRIVIGKDIWLT